MTPDPLQQPATVLIIDDTPANLGVMVDTLEHQGIQVLVAEDGEEGLARARFVRPDVILLDVMMPGMDGFETCRRLRLDPATGDIPVIFMTALDQSDDKVSAFRAGAVDYLTKPCHPAEVVARVNTHVALHRLQKRLRSHNRQLAEEVAERRRMEAELQRHRDHLEELVAQRTVELREARDQAEAANRAKGRFLANVSHDFRTPMHAILSYSELGRRRLEGDGLQPEKLLQYFDAIHESGERLMLLVNNLLDLVAADEGRPGEDEGRQAGP